MLPAVAAPEARTRRWTGREHGGGGAADHSAAAGRLHPHGESRISLRRAGVPRAQAPFRTLKREFCALLSVFGAAG